MLNTVEIIRKKRDGKELSAKEISYFIKTFLTGETADYQMTALLMAIYLNGFTDAETQSLTEEMLFSGETIDFSFLNKATIDKHSTGGVGDKTSLVIAPIAAAAGLCVPMISGRALGHTGGTLDKLESIPGYRVNLSLEEFKLVIEKVGVSIIGQTEKIAPADRKIYSLRDVTATVESIPLITASIMSKKLAEGLDCLLLDVKCGNGAFMRTLEDAQKLAQSMVNVGNRMKRRTAAFITTMEQPLGWSVGNSLEVMESIETLKGQNTNDFYDLCIELSAMMIYLGKVASSIEEGQKLAKDLINSGAALEKFRQMVDSQGGNSKVIDDFSLLPQAKFNIKVLSSKQGYVTEINTLAIGQAAMNLGAGRQKVDSVIDHGVGLRIEAKIGTYLEVNQPLATIYYSNDSLVAETKEQILNAYKIGQEKPLTPVLIKEVIQ